MFILFVIMHRYSFIVGTDVINTSIKKKISRLKGLINSSRNYKSLTR